MCSQCACTLWLYVAGRTMHDTMFSFSRLSSAWWHTKCVPCTRHRISSALFWQPTPVYRPTRNCYKTLVSDDWLGIIIVQLCLILLVCAASFDFTFCPLRESAGRAEPFKLAHASRQMLFVRRGTPLLMDIPKHLRDKGIASLTHRPLIFFHAA